MEVQTFQLPERFAPIIRLLADEAPKQVDASKALASVFLTLHAPANCHIHILLGQGMPVELDTHLSTLLGPRVSFYPMNTASLFGVLEGSLANELGDDLSHAVIAIGREKLSTSPYLQVQEETAKRLLVDERVLAPASLQTGAPSASRAPSVTAQLAAGYVLQDEQGNFKLAGGPSRSNPRGAKGMERQSSWLIGGMLLSKRTEDANHTFRLAVLAPDPRSFGGFEFAALGESVRELTGQPAKRVWTTGLGVSSTYACLKALKDFGSATETCTHLMPDASGGVNTVASCLEMLLNSEPGDLLLDFSASHVRGVYKC